MYFLSFFLSFFGLRDKHTRSNTICICICTIHVCLVCSRISAVSPVHSQPGSTKEGEGKSEDGTSATQDGHGDNASGAPQPKATETKGEEKLEDIN